MRADGGRNVVGWFKLVVFDYNGTLQDDVEHLYIHGVRYVFARFGLEAPPFDVYRAEITHGISAWYHRHGIPERLGLSDLEAIFVEGLRRVSRPELFLDARRALAVVRATLGRAPMLVSGYPHEDLLRLLRHHAIDGSFAHVAGGTTDKAAAFAVCCARADVPPYRTAVVGDLVSDAEAAHAVGAVPFIVSRGFEGPDHIEAARASIPTLVHCRSLDEFLRYL